MENMPQSNIVACWADTGEALVTPEWLVKGRSLKISPLGFPAKVRVEIYVGNEDLYDYFPFNIWIYANGEAIEVIEIDKPNRLFQFGICLNANDPCHLEFDSELSGNPRRKGLGEDARDLIILINSLAYTPNDGDDVSAEVNVRPVKSALRPKLFALSDHSKIEPIFIIGSYRSGTSISGWALGQHPNIYVLEENSWMSLLYHSTLGAYKMSHQASVNSVDTYNIGQDEFLQWQGEAIHNLHLRLSSHLAIHTSLSRLGGSALKWDSRFQILRSQFSPKKRWVDATPENSMFALGLAKMFPNAKFIFMLRQPKNVISSLIRFDAMGVSAYDFEAAVKIWEERTYRGYETLQKLGAHRVKLSLYDSITQAPEALLEDWFQFLNEPRFRTAIECLSKRINSSGEYKTEELKMDEQELERLDCIYKGIIDNVAMADLPWKLTFGNQEEVQDYICRSIVAAIS